jgi:hypothetical protein
MPRFAKRLLVWILVLAAAVAAGFGLGALTYKPPNPDVQAAQTTAGTSGTPTPTPSSSSPPVEIVPDLVGMQRVAAEAKLKKIDILFLVEPVAGANNDKVVAQSPPPGTSAAQAKHVLIKVQCRPAPCPQPPEGKQLYDPCGCLWR